MIDQRVTELSAQRVSFVRARVVLAEKPTSAKAGDQAIVLPDGTIEGFVGGSCAESTVRAQALALLDSGETLLLRITPQREEAAVSVGSVAGRMTVHNPCLSGGTLEIFLEPVRPAPVLVIIGDTPIARSLANLGRSMGYELGADPANATAVVVASHGRDEEDTLRSALSANAEYIGLVASTKRGAAVLGSLGMCTSHTSRVHTPAGLDIGATTPDEIALSILAEIVSCRPRPTGRPIVESQLAADAQSPMSSVGGSADGMSGVSVDSANADAEAKLSVPVGMGANNNMGANNTGSKAAGRVGMAIDPVCSMTVAMVESSLHFDSDGQRFWFCGSGCLRAFAAAPDDYASLLGKRAYE
jgi:xanthine dehydrogenase accessory factor